MSSDSDPRVRSRAENLLPEEEAVGSDDPDAQAQALIEESDERQLSRADPSAPGVESRRSEDTVEPPD